MRARERAVARRINKVGAGADHRDGGAAARSAPSCAAASMPSASPDTMVRPAFDSASRELPRIRQRLARWHCGCRRWPGTAGQQRTCGPLYTAAAADRGFQAAVQDSRLDPAPARWLPGSAAPARVASISACGGDGWRLQQRVRLSPGHVRGERFTRRLANMASGLPNDASSRRRAWPRPGVRSSLSHAASAVRVLHGALTPVISRRRRPAPGRSPA
jgi:hypothetical protein